MWQAQLVELKRQFENIDKENLSCHKTVFISVCDTENRAIVVKACEKDWDQSFSKASEKLEKRLKKKNINPKWLKLDWVVSENKMSYKEFIEAINLYKANYFRYGIAFDDNYTFAFLEQELNSNAIIQDRGDQTQAIAWNNVKFYIKGNYDISVELNDQMVNSVILFETNALFIDEEMNCYELNSYGLKNGVRKIDELSIEFLENILRKSSQYLMKEINAQGKYNYGYFPCFDKNIPTYNTLRHSSTTYSLVEVYEITRDELLLNKIRSAIDYVIDNDFVSIKLGLDEKGFILEENEDREIKLGANAVTILAIVKYYEITKDDRYNEIAIKLGHGIRHFQNSDGSFNHILSSSDYSVKEASRIIYYDGEAAFALLKLYHLDKNPIWLAYVNQAFNYFIENNYEKYHDHWLSYCSCELFFVSKEEHILRFNLANAQGIADFALERITTYPTLLELFMATNRVLYYCQQNRLYPETLNAFDLDKIYQAMNHRANYQLNGFLFPEVAMYFKKPSKILNGFYIRHHSFRVRIDDVEHNLSGYSNYYLAIREDRFFNPK